MDAGFVAPGELREVLLRAGVLVLPSLHECGGAVVLESAAATSSLGPTAELGAGLTVTAGSVDVTATVTDDKATAQVTVGEGAILAGDHGLDDRGRRGRDRWRRRPRVRRRDVEPRPDR